MDPGSEAATALDTLANALAQQLASSPFSTPDKARAALRLATERDEMRRQVDEHERDTGGVRLDTLFVDEGFGTLDSDALQLAMNELDRLREGGRAVGLISHVAGLRERIRLGIEVHPSDRGSTLRVGTVSPA